jgi:hypothetical protein
MRSLSIKVLIYTYTLQNYIILIPNGPKACPILGLGLAIPAYTSKLILAIY